MTNNSSILIKNVYYMLAYAYRSLSLNEYKDVSDEEFEHIHDMFASLLARGIASQLKHGLYREYVVREEALTTLRGKIDAQGSVGLRLARKRQLACEFDEISEDIDLNRILKATCMLLIRHGKVKPANRAALKKLMMFFSDVDVIDLRSVSWSSIRFTRSSKPYRMLIGICQLVAEGLLLTNQDGTHKLRSFVDDSEMSRLYEKFILEYYREHHNYLKPSARHIKWALTDGDLGMLPAMRSDIMLRRGSETLVIDAKYYSRNTQVNFDRHSISSANMYQIFTYVNNLKVDLEHMYPAKDLSVAGMLLYARTDEEVQPAGDWTIAGNQFAVRTLDLNQDFRSIAAQLDSIVIGSSRVESASY